MVAPEQVGLRRPALDLVPGYAKERVVFDRPLGKSQAVASPLDDSWIRLEAADRMARHVADLYDANKPSGRRSAPPGTSAARPASRRSVPTWRAAAADACPARTGSENDS